MPAGKAMASLHGSIMQFCIYTTKVHECFCMKRHQIVLVLKIDNTKNKIVSFFQRTNERNPAREMVWHLGINI